MVPKLWSEKQTDKQRLQLNIYRLNYVFNRSSRRNPPDIMPGQPGDQIPAGQLDLVNDNAASWFDNFAANPQGTFLNLWSFMFWKKFL